MADLNMKLVIRGPAAASKMSGLQVQITFNSSRNVSGDLSFTLKDVITNDMIAPKTHSVSVNTSGSGTANFNLGDIFNTPKTGAYLVVAHMNGSSSNELAIKMLL